MSRTMAAIACVAATLGWSGPSQARDFDDNTACKALTRSYRTHNQPDMRRAGVYIAAKFKAVEAVIIFQGKPGILNSLTEGQALAMVDNVADQCADMPELEIGFVVLSVYAATSIHGFK